MNPLFATTLFALTLALSTAARAEELVLGCHGTTNRDEGAGVRRSLPIVVEVRVNGADGSLKISGLSCWAGRGDCSKLSARVFENSIKAIGDGQLSKTGMVTAINIDRRSGYMKFSQGRDPASQSTPTTGPQSEEAELICNGGTIPRF
jgi:hypothetical protein